MEAFLHQVFSGLANGAIYGSLALALVMIYQSTHHINFAQGELAMFSTYLAWAMINAGVSYWTAFALTVVVFPLTSENSQTHARNPRQLPLYRAASAHRRADSPRL